MAIEAGSRGISVRRSLSWGIKWAALYLACFHVIKLLRGAVIPKLLAPLSYGLCNTALLPLNYARYTDLGILDQLGKRLPLRLGAEGEAAFREEAGKGASWILITSLATAVVLFASSYFVHGQHASFFRLGMRLIAGIAFMQKSRLFFAAALTAKEEFRSTATSAAITDLSSFVFAAGFVIWLGAIGVLWGALIAETLGTVYNVRENGLIGPRFAPREMLQMVSGGILLLIVAVTEVVMMTTDQLFLVRFFSLADYGLYCLGLFMTSALLSGSALFMTAQPRILQLVGASREAEAREILCGSLFLYGIILAAGIGILIPMMTVVIRFYLPRYVLGVSLYMLLSGVAIGRGPVMLLRPFFLARNQERRLILCQVAGLATMAAIDALVVLNHGKLFGIALGSICGYTLTGALLIIQFEKSFADVARARLRRYSLYIASCIGCGTLYAFYLVHPEVEPAWRYIGQAVTVTAVCLLLMLVLIYVVRADLATALRVMRRVGEREEGLPELVESESLTA